MCPPSRRPVSTACLPGLACLVVWIAGIGVVETPHRYRLASQRGHPRWDRGQGLRSRSVGIEPCLRRALPGLASVPNRMGNQTRIASGKLRKQVDSIVWRCSILGCGLLRAGMSVDGIPRSSFGGPLSNQLPSNPMSGDASTLHRRDSHRRS